MIEQILDECLEEIHARRLTVPACLAKFPNVRAELEPLLRLALMVERLPDVKPNGIFKQEVRNRLLRAPAPPPKLSRKLLNFLTPRRAS